MGKLKSTRERLTELGMELMFKNGFDAVSVSDICKEAEVSRTTFYLHFKSKEQLIAEYYSVNDDFLNYMKKWITNTPNPWISIIRMQSLYIYNICDNNYVGLVSRFLSWQLAGSEEEYRLGFSSEMENVLVDLIRKAQQEGLVQNMTDPNRLCKVISMMQSGNMFDWCASKGEYNSYNDFFWNLEALFQVREDLRGLWKYEV